MTSETVMQATYDAWYEHLDETDHDRKSELLHKFHVGILTLKTLGISAQWDDLGFLKGWSS